MKHETEEERWAYNCEDCVRTRECGEVEAENLKKMGLEEVDAFQQRLFWAVLRTMNRGVRIDLKAKNEFAMTLLEEMSTREAFFMDVLGHPLNPRSSLQMTKLFYEDLAQRPIMSRPKPGSPSHLTCDDEALEILKAREPLLRPIINAIAEYRSLGVFLSTFVNAQLDYDGRMRCSFNICGTETYRFSSSKNAFGSGTNLQNIPKGGEEDDSDLELPNVRKLFAPDPGFTFFDLDLSKADLRVVVWEADETEMKAMLAEGRDPYVETAREFYRDPTITKSLASGRDHPKYKVFKSFSHGTHYMGSAAGLARRLGISTHESERTQKWYLGKYPRIRKWHERIKETVDRTHKVRNAFGYERFYFDRIGDDTYRQAAAWIPQSTIACLINRIYVNFHERLKEVEILLQVHDSLSGQFPTSNKQAYLKRMEEEAQVIIPYADSLVIPVGIKTSEASWGDCG